MRSVRYSYYHEDFIEEGQRKEKERKVLYEYSGIILRRKEICRIYGVSRSKERKEKEKEKGTKEDRDNDDVGEITQERRKKDKK